jgi:hypothetical protein
MSAAFVEFADRFDPDELKAAFERSIGSKPMLGFLNRLKYWELYCDLYPVMTEKGGGRFPHMFAEEFVQSYERQINEFKRLGPVSAHPAPVLEPLAEEDFNDENSDDEKSDDEVFDDEVFDDEVFDDAAFDEEPPTDQAKA